MRSLNKYRANYLDIDVNRLKLIGQGHEGKVYLLHGGKVLKVFHMANSCRRQIEILLNARGSRFFPTVYGYDSNSIVMSFVYGSTLAYYLKKNKIDKHLSFELVKLIDEFKGLQFTKLDMRLGHIYLQPYETIKVIDPRGSYNLIVPYPKTMLKGLREHNALKDFFEYIRYDYPDYYKYWRKKL
jgi:hypothetical protein